MRKQEKPLLAIKLGIYTHLTNIKGENGGGRGCFLSRNTEQDQPFKKIGVMYSEKDGNA
jgi:hypothetical protein